MLETDIYVSFIKNLFLYTDETRGSIHLRKKISVLQQICTISQE